MMGLRLAKAPSELLQVLCLGAHSDDIEIGCGGTLLELTRTFKNVAFSWVVFSAAGVRSKEAARGAELFTAGNKKQVLLKDFRDGFLPYTGSAVKEAFEKLKGQVQPEPHFHSLAGRCSPGSSPGFGPDLEHLPQSLNP